MKKFILFLFLVTNISIQNANAQDIGDEFIDPGFNTGAGAAPGATEVPPPDFQSSSASGEAPETSATPSQVSSESIPLETEFQPQPLANDQTSSVSSSGGDVIIEQQTDLTESYKRRRGKHGVLFSLNYEKFNPVDYYSMYGDQYIEKFLGDSEGIGLLSIELGYKLNFKLGSIAILGNFATGSQSNSKYSEDNNVTFLERGLSLTRYGLSANFALDNVLEEPWIVPYGQVGVHQFSVSENFDKQDTNDTTTQFAFNYRLGLLFQLNWIEKAIDPSTQIDGLRSSGLQNTFIDLYVTTHMASSEVYEPVDGATEEGDPDLSTGMDLGVGLKMEF